MKKFFYLLLSNFNPLRWSLFAVTVSFVAIVGVYDYIDLSTSVAITFSSFETTFVLLTNPTSLAFIFMPLYLFIVCGIPTHEPYGTFLLLRYKNRGQWLRHKWLCLVSYTLLFFAGLFALTFIIASQAFPYQAMWSTDFVNLQVSLGQEVANFVYPPLTTIGLSLLGACLLYVFAGSITMVCGLKTHSEPLSLAISMVVGLASAAGCNYLWFVQRSVLSQSMQATVFALASLVLMAFSPALVKQMDFQTAKKG